MDNRGAVIRFPIGARVFLFPKSSRLSYCSAGTGGSLSEGKRTGGKAEHLLLSNVKFDKARRYTPISHTPSQHEYFDIPRLGTCKLYGKQKNKEQ